MAIPRVMKMGMGELRVTAHSVHEVSNENYCINVSSNEAESSRSYLKQNQKTNKKNLNSNKFSKCITELYVHVPVK